MTLAHFASESGTTGGPPASGDASARAVYFGPPERRAFGWYHAAHGPLVRDCAVVLCANLAHEKSGHPRALRHWAEALAAAGIAALRFDYHGEGDAGGDGREPGRVQAWIDNAVDATEFVRAQSGASQIVLAGVRIGAAFALAAAKRSNVKSLILWAAQPTGKSFLREGRAFTRLMAPTLDATLPDGAEQLGGFLLDADTVRDLDALDPLEAGAAIAARALVIPRDDMPNDSAFVERLGAAGVTVERVEAAGYSSASLDAHSAEVPRRVIAATVDWLAGRFSARRAEFANGATPAAQSLTLPVTRSAQGRPSRAPVMHEQPINFGPGGQLFGILTRPPDQVTRRTGVLVVNAGAVHRVGPNRLWVTLAREWASLGYTVLRMDIGGLGDSPTPQGGDENHSYPDHAVTDIAAGAAELRARGAERVVVGGLCSGAHATFHAGLALADLDGLLIINPIVFYWKPSDPLDVAAWLNYYEAMHYGRSVRTRQSWARLISGKVDVRRVARVMGRRFAEIARAKFASVARQFGDGTEPENAANDLARMAKRNQDVFLLFSERDPGHDYLMLNYSRELRTLAKMPKFRLQLLRDADHTFTSLDARRRAAALLTEHLVSHHP